MMSIHDNELSPTHDALNRMRRASERGTGCRLTAEMIASLAISTIGQMWGEKDPRHEDENPRPRRAADLGKEVADE